MPQRARPPIEVMYPGLEGEDASVEIDIVAVHGLGANVDWSWTWRDKTRPGSSVNWLKDPDMLPAIVPNARILAYNYNSRWHVDAPKTRLQLCGEEFIRSLHDFRDGLHDRPLVFVGHSLGGLVIQHALLFADREDEYRYLPRHTAGLVALGSPFRGTKMHGLANFAAKLLSPAGSHAGVLESLGYENPLLRDKMQEFCRLQKSLSISICCFFEAFVTDYGRRFGIPRLFQEMVVPEESACVPGCERMQLQCDHLKLNKFSGPHDRSFLSVSRHIRSMCKKWKGKIEPQADDVKGYWIVPFERNQGFVGREDILRDLSNRITPRSNKDSCQRTVIEGLGGIGKTQLALEAAFRLRHNEPLCSVFWVPAMDAMSFENAYRKIGQVLGVAGIDEDGADIKMLVAMALNYDKGRQWLMIIDNADDPRLFFGSMGLSNYLPRSVCGSILFTTRTHEVAVRLDIELGGTIRTAKMGRQEAVEMLQTRLTRQQIQDRQSTDQLLDFLDDLPLAIKQASAFMQKTGISAERYLEHCQSSDATLVNLLSRDFEDRGRYETIKNPIATTWFISFEHMSRDCARADEYLRFMSFLAERDIPVSILPPATDELEADEAIGKLTGYGFVTKREDAMSLDMHRLVRLAMRNWLQLEVLISKTYLTVIQQVNTVFPYPKFENREIWMKYIRHAQSVLNYEGECDHAKAMRQLMWKVAATYYALGNYEDAGKMFRKALVHSLAMLGEEHAGTLNIMADLGSTLEKQGRYREAETIHRQTLEARTKLLGLEDPQIYESKLSLAVALWRQSMHKEAEAMLWQVLDFRKKAFGKEHRDTLSTMTQLAAVLVNRGKYTEAEKMLKEALRWMKVTYGMRHTDSLTTMHNLASTTRAQGRYSEAEIMNRELLKSRIECLGQEHPDTLVTMSNLALTIQDQGRLKEAEDIHLEVLELGKKILGKEHPITLQSMYNFAWGRYLQGSYDEAEVIYRQILNLREKVLGKEHLETVDSIDGLASAVRSQGRYEEAQIMHEHELQLREKLLGREHPHTLRSVGNLALALRGQGRHEEADQLASRYGATV